MKTNLVAILLAAIAGVAYGAYSANSKYGEKWRPATVVSPHGEPVSTEGAPKVVVVLADDQDPGEEPEQYNFDAMERGEGGERVFLFRNDGEGVLTLKLGKASCKCTGTKLTRDRLRPGETSEVTVEWDTSEKEPGPISLSAPVITNDPERPTVVLRVTGSIATTFQVQPRVFSLGEVREGDPKEATVRLFGFRSDPIRVTDYKFANAETAEQFELEIEDLPEEDLELNESKSGQVLRIRTTGELPIGRLNQQVNLTTNDPDMPPIQVDITGSVVGDLRVAGRDFDATSHVLDLGTFQASEGVEKSLFILIGGPHREETEVEIASVEPESVQVTLGEPQVLGGGSLTRIPVTIVIPPNAPPESRLGGTGGPLGKIEFQTTHPVYDHFEVGLQYFSLGG